MGTVRGIRREGEGGRAAEVPGVFPVRYFFVVGACDFHAEAEEVFAVDGVEGSRGVLFEDGLYVVAVGGG